MLALAAAAAIVVAGCGSGAATTERSSPSAGQGGDVTVVAKDIKFAAADYRAAAGSVHVTYRNEGSIEHTLKIDGVDGFKLDVPANGDVDDATVQLAAGSYTIYCDVAGHREAGMHGTLTVGI
jgi:plastocyanin